MSRLEGKVAVISGGNESCSSRATVRMQYDRRGSRRKLGFPAIEVGRIAEGGRLI